MIGYEKTEKLLIPFRILFEKNEQSQMRSSKRLSIKGNISNVKKWKMPKANLLKTNLSKELIILNGTQINGLEDIAKFLNLHIQLFERNDTKIKLNVIFKSFIVKLVLSLLKREQLKHEKHEEII